MKHPLFFDFLKKVFFQFVLNQSFYIEIYILYITQKSFVDTFSQRLKIIISQRVHFPRDDELPVDFLLISDTLKQTDNGSTCVALLIITDVCKLS